MVIDDEKDEVQSISSTTEPTAFLIMEAKESEFNLPDDRSPTKAAATKKTATKTTSNSINSLFKMSCNQLFFLKAQNLKRRKLQQP
mgnify:CR=1 FL=1